MATYDANKWLRAILKVITDSGHPEWLQDVRLMDNMPVTMMKINPGIKAPEFVKITDDGAGSDGVYTYSFNSTIESETFFSWFLNCRWKVGTEVYPVVRWSPDVDGAVDEVVEWALEYYVRGFGGTLTNSIITTIHTHQPIETITAGTMYVSIFPPVDMSNYLFGSSPEIVGRLFRDSTDRYGVDTYSGNAHLLSFGFVLQVDKPGESALNLPYYYIAE